MIKQKKVQKKDIYVAIEYKHVRTLRIIYLIVAGILTVSILLLVRFIYTNMFAAFEEANVVIVLKSELNIRTLNIERLENVRLNWNDHLSNKEFKSVRNPFIAPILLENSSLSSTESKKSDINTPVIIELDR